MYNKFGRQTIDASSLRVHTHTHTHTSTHTSTHKHAHTLDVINDLYEVYKHIFYEKK